MFQKAGGERFAPERSTKVVPVFIGEKTEQNRFRCRQICRLASGPMAGSCLITSVS